MNLTKRLTLPLGLMSALAMACSSGPSGTLPEEASASAGGEVASNDFADYDGDGDRELTLDEFDSALDDVGYFSSWDSDGNGELTDLEYQTGMFNAWDTDGDEIVDTYEFRDANEAWLTAYDVDFADWDADGDLELTWVEFQRAAADLDLYSSWDADGNGELVDLEYRTALFNAWDTDGDERIDTYEYRW